VGKKADIVLIKNDASPTMFPILNPYGHITLQASRGDVHTVVIDGRLVKHEDKLVGNDLTKAKEVVGNTVEYLVDKLGEDVWQNGMYPDVPEKKLQENPYTYTTWDAGSAQWKQ
jgi:5-methylthioadenosine/S-adenosylhomocysteine deaminase